MECTIALYQQTLFQSILSYDFNPQLFELHDIDFCLIGLLTESWTYEYLSTCTEVAELECLLVSSWLIADIFENVALFVSDFNLVKKKKMRCQ